MNVEQTLQRLEALFRSLTEATAVFLCKGPALLTAEGFGMDKEMVSELDSVFSNALQRSKKVWTLTVTMTLASFGLIMLMILLAVMLALIKDNHAWAMIFGGASVPLIVGTLIWRPFDRMFRSTILTQQLEMIHIQTVTAFRATMDVEKRVQICRESFQELSLLFEKHAQPEDRKRR